MTVDGYTVQIVEAPRQFIRLSYEGGQQCEWGRKAAKAIREYNKLQQAGDANALKLWLITKRCNGF